MRKLTTVVLFLFMKNGYAQMNLVPNYSFEDTISCPNSTYSLNQIYDWFYASSGSPDVFNKCTTTSLGIPYNFAGFQYPKTGNGYGGFLLFHKNGEFREYMETKLSSPLLAGKIYCVNFCFSFADYSKYAIDRIGLVFTSDSLLRNDLFHFPKEPDVENLEGNIIFDTVNWLQISGKYTAIGNENFITIGNFYDDINTGDSVVGGFDIWAYYYIDDVTVCQIDSFPPGFVGPDTLLCDSNTNGIIIGMPSPGGYSYAWSPIYGLTDTTAAQPVAKPDSTTTYFLTVTDTFRYRCRQGEVVARDTVTVSVTKCIGIEEFSAKGGSAFGGHVIPNPGNGIFTFSISNNQYQIINVDVYNILGQKVAGYALNPPRNSFRMDVSFLDNGMYYYSFATEGGVRVNGKIVILK